MTAEVGRSEVFRRRLAEFANQSERIHDGDVEALHRTRVASRRLRELLPVLEPDAVRKLGSRLRKVTQRLGVVRELDVLTIVIEELRRDDRIASAALQLVDDAVAERREAEQARLVEKLPAARLERLARSLEKAASRLESIETRGTLPRMPGPRRAWMWALEARVSHRAARALAAIDAAGVVYLPERLHGARIALKKLRYAMELLAELQGRRTTAGVATLKHAQDALGRLHDLEVLIDRTRSVQASIAPPDLTAWRQLGALVRALEDDCRQLHARYLRDRRRLVAIANRAAGVARTEPASAGRRAAS